ncbi:MAG: acetyl-CoA carboxylase biotin carboxylase subunit family protein [Flavobacterium sp.]
MASSKTFLCISNYFKGNDFLIAMKALGNRVYLVTSEKLKDKPWARESLDDIFYMPGQDTDWNMQDLLYGVAAIIRHTKIDSIIALDDFDVEKATYLREHLRIPGMGQTTGRYFRDKLAMRMKAKEGGVLVPAFSSLFHDADIQHFADTVPAPWVLKPRSEASANGIIKVHNTDELWHHIHQLGDQRIYYLVEQFKPGNVLHCDGLNWHGKVLYANASQYLSTPMEVSQGGGVFRSRTIPYDSDLYQDVLKANGQVMQCFGMQNGATHTEFIQSHEDGKIYFLETSSRVGGAHLAEMVEGACGINMWKEWAAIEHALVHGTKYKLPKPKKEFAGIVLTLSKYEWPDLSGFNDPEICFIVPLAYHAGLIVKSKKIERVQALLDDYVVRLANDFATVAPPEQVKKLH